MASVGIERVAAVDGWPDVITGAAGTGAHDTVSVNVPRNELVLAPRGALSQRAANRDNAATDTQFSSPDIAAPTPQQKGSSIR